MARILTIDDDDAVRSIVAHALTRDGHSVIQAAVSRSLISWAVSRAGVVA